MQTILNHALAERVQRGSEFVDLAVERANSLAEQARIKRELLELMRGKLL